MEEFCTCGARLVDGARFCHKCGRPVREEYAKAEEPEPIAAPPPLPSAVAAEAAGFPPIGFRNRIAVRGALVAATVTCFLIMIPVPIVQAIGTFVFPVAGGFFAVYLYRRRTGIDVSLGSGARLGWMTGIFCFLYATIVITLLVLVFADPAMRDATAAVMRSRPGGADAVAQMQELMESPLTIIAALVSVFFVFTALPTLGGALGAKVLEKE